MMFCVPSEKCAVCEGFSESFVSPASDHTSLRGRADTPGSRTRLQLPADMPDTTPTGSPLKDQNALDRLRNVPVPVIVKLAEKRIELGQLLAIGPGAIITFEKSCEDLLDLHVNNQLYCRGEAVKIGEKFGIKICEVGSAEERLSAVLATP